MGRIPEEIIAQVIDRCDIVEIISAHVLLKQAGRNFKGNCPFHNEKTPSFVVNPDKQIFHCFGCGVGGNVITFIMKQERMEFPESIRILAQKVNVEIPETQRSTNTQGANIRQDVFNVNTLAVEYFHNNLLFDKNKAFEAPRRYLKNRKISLETVKQFQLGFAPEQWDGLIGHLRDKGVPLSLMEKAGLIIARESKQGYYDRFRNRIIFPIFDTQAHCRAFGGRILTESGLTDQSTAKYINSPETPVYVKGHHLYGFHMAKETIGREDSVIIVEGYMDCIVPFQAGVTNIVASLGTALTVEQIRLLRRYTRNVVMSFDMDPAGESAMLRSLDTLIEEGMTVKVAKLSEGYDPDSFICDHGVDAFHEQVSKAKTLFEYKLGILMTRYDATAIEGKARISGEMLQTIDKFDSEVAKAEYMKSLSRTLMVSEQALFTELRKVRTMTGDKKSYGKLTAPKIPVQAQLRVVESDILQLLLEEESLIEATKKEIEVSDFQDERIREVIAKIYELVEEGKDISSANLIASFDDVEMQQMLTRLLAKENIFAGDKKKIHSDYVNRMKKDRIKLQMKEVQRKIQEAERQGNQTELVPLISEYNRLMKKVSL